MSFILFSTFFLNLFAPQQSLAQDLRAFGYTPGYDTPQLLSFDQIEKIKFVTHDTVPTWLAIATGLDTDQAQLHLIDTEYFKQFPSDFGIHQAYAQEMGIVSGKADFIAQLTADGVPRKIMPFTFYIPKTTLAKGGVNAQWVLQNRRYIFKDNSASFTNSLEQAAKLFKQNLGGLVFGNPFFVTYEQEKNSSGGTSTRRPNLLTDIGRADIAALKGKLYTLVTEQEMAVLAGESPPLVKVHNSNEDNQAFGYIKVVRTEDDINELTPQHIAIFPSLPDRIPPVAAIVTLEAQTELSHINVLAINRGTLNVAISQEAKEIITYVIQKSQEMGQNPIKLKLTGESVSMTPTSNAQVAEFQIQLKKLIGEVEIPQVEFDGVIGVKKASKEDSPTSIGAKAANYGRLERLLGSDQVKPGFAIDFDLYRHIVSRGGEDSIELAQIHPLIQKVKLGQITPKDVNDELEQIRLSIQNAEIPSHLILSLETLANSEYSYLSADEKIRFRSSTNCEDLPRFNGAGLYLSNGIKIKHLRRAATVEKSFNKIREKLLLVMGSLWLPRAFWEREYFSIDHKKAALAVQINPSFSDEAANGVIIANLKDGVVNYWINSQFGEASVTNPLPGEIPESIKFSSSGSNTAEIKADMTDSSLRPQSISSLEPIFLTAESKIDPDKMDLFVQLLVSSQKVLIKMVDDTETFGIDIEFKLMKEAGVLKLYLKQARPINLGLSHDK